jgi:hypothetical protein
MKPSSEGNLQQQQSLVVVPEMAPISAEFLLFLCERILLLYLFLDFKPELTKI